MSNRSYLSIGDVLSLLRQEFPDVTISKIRFLESQGLVNPERSPSGYRKFYERDVARLRWVLLQQREHFLPLKVIRDRLEREGDQVLDEVPPLPGRDDLVAVGADLPGPKAAPPQESPRHEAMATVSAFPASAAGRRPQEHRQDEPDPTAPGPSANAGGDPSGSAQGAGEPPASPGVHLARAQEGSSGGVAPHEGDAKGRDDHGDHPSRGGAGLVRAQDDPGQSVPPGPPRGAAPPGEAARASAAAGSDQGSSAPAGAEQTARPREPEGVGQGASGPPSGAGLRLAQAGTGASLTQEELCAAAGISPEHLAALERFGLVEALVVAGVPYYDEDALAVTRLAAELAEYGVEPRHLTLYRNAVDREVGLVEQIITPLLRQRNPEARQRAVETTADLTRLGESLRAALLRRELRRQLGT